ncbi:MAG: hypothetical protein MAG453_00513 [Calditrichaeota bacterium]|nr:hypothetical protein [Calditrichota bacterium]
MAIQPEQLVRILDDRFQQLIDRDYAATIPTVMPGMTAFAGVRVPELRKLAKQIRREFRFDVADWIAYLGHVMPSRHRERILVGVFGLDGRTRDLDDLFGERLSGWARHLDNWETTDQLGPVAGNWVLGDLSRVGYLEAWAVHGETVWKRRLAAVATISLNRGPHGYTHESLRVLRHLMNAREEPLRTAVAWALREQKDREAVERFLAWWAPRVNAGFIRDAAKKLPPERIDHLLQLAH